MLGQPRSGQVSICQVRIDVRSVLVRLDWVRSVNVKLESMSVQYMSD